MEKNPYYDTFFNHPFIKTIADNEKWTVSTVKKMPIDMYSYMYKHMITGALYNDNLSLVSLPVLNNILPNAANYAYYLDGIIDDFVILDIEPKCPDDIKAKLLTMKPLYAEKSMSGKGIHMVFPLPASIMNKYPAAQEKKVLKEKSSGYYEILINHYVTFTGNIINLPDCEPVMAFEELFEELAAKQTIVQKTELDFDELKPVDTNMLDTIFDLLQSAAARYTKTPADFLKNTGKPDFSRYEYAYISYLNQQLSNIMKVQVIKNEHTYDNAEKAWILYTAVQEFIPKRDKHNEMRCGMPWLMYLVKEVMAKNQTNEKKKR